MPRFSNVVPSPRSCVMKRCESSAALSRPVVFDISRYCFRSFSKSPLRIASIRFSSMPRMFPYWLASHVGFFANAPPRSDMMSTVSRSSPLALRVCTPSVAR